MDKWHFAHPWLAIPLALLLAYWAYKILRPSQQASIGFPHADAISNTKKTRRAHFAKHMPWIPWLAGLLLSIAMLRPQTPGDIVRLKDDGIDIILTIDASQSMEALDLDTYRPIHSRRNRLAVVVDVVKEFIDGRKNDQIGLVVFGSHAFTQCPLTLDHDVLQQFVRNLHTGMAGKSTSIGVALATSLKRLEASKAKSKIIVLLTDGRSNSGDISPQDAANLAQSLGIKVYTIGAGSHGKAPYLVDSYFGQTVQYEDVDIDEETLQSIAQKTGGLYFRAETINSLKSIYQQIDTMERSEIDSLSYREMHEHFAPWVIAALTLLLLYTLASHTWLRTLP